MYFLYGLIKFQLAMTLLNFVFLLGYLIIFDEDELLSILLNELYSLMIYHFQLINVVVHKPYLRIYNIYIRLYFVVNYLQIKIIYLIYRVNFDLKEMLK